MIIPILATFAASATAAWYMRERQRDAANTLPPSTEERYGIAPGYVARAKNRAFDDTGNQDEWQREVYLTAAEIMRANGFTRVIDVGCGSGFKLMRYLGQYDTLGLDVSPTLEFLRATYPDRRWAQSDFDARGLSADVVICSDVIEHLPDPDALVAFIRAIPCAAIVLSTPERALSLAQWGGPTNGPPKNRTHFREWSFAEFRRYLNSYFDVIRHVITNVEQSTQMVVCRNRSR
jgi:2-polyprenyl-3-methyl-5-hydroxy-6-metoxy-1,4-benzoquinol methylase